MKAFQFGALSMFCFGLQNYFIEKYLSKSSPYTNLIIMYVSVLCIMIPTSFIVKGTKLDPHPVLPMPLWWAAVVVGIIYAFADVFYFSAYLSGGDIFFVTTLPLLLPIFSSIIKSVLDRVAPSPYHYAAWALGALALFVLSLAPKASIPTN